MELSEDDTDRYEEEYIPEDLGAAPGGQESNFSSGPGAQEQAIDSGNVDLPGTQWFVEVVPGQVSDSANRISCAIDLLLAAVARPK